MRRRLYSKRKVKEYDHEIIQYYVIYVPFYIELTFAGIILFYPYSI